MARPHPAETPSATPGTPPSGSECPAVYTVPCPSDQIAPDPDDDPSAPPAQCCDYSPILVDVLGDGFSLTAPDAGVPFDFNGDGRRSLFSWTEAGSDDSWLALDRDGDGAIDDASELFGNFTEQPSSPRPNGFLALAEFDRAERGGNSDGAVDARDEVFGRLRLWRDADHDGESEAGELHALPALGVTGIGLGYREAGRRDRWGNQFRYRARAYGGAGGDNGRWAYDVFLVAAR